MIDREQVLHVARLARLELSEDEVARMTGELSAILDHIEKISALDPDAFPPTPHVVEVPNALRPCAAARAGGRGADRAARGRAAAVPAARRRAGQRTGRRRRRLLRPEPDRMTARGDAGGDGGRPGELRRAGGDIVALTAAQAAAAVAKGDLDRSELFEAWRARAAGDDLNAFLWVADAAPSTNGAGAGPLGGVPLGVKDLFCTE